MAMSKGIHLSRGKVTEIAAAFKCSRQTVWSALKFETKTDLADKIRALALAKGGAEYDSSRNSQPK